MGLLDKAKEALFTETPDAPKRPRNTPLPPMPSPHGHPPAPFGGFGSRTPTKPAPITTASYAPPAQAADADPQATQKLEEILQAKMPPAYQAFIDQYEKLRPIIPDESTRFKAAVVSSNSTVEALSTALDNLITVLDGAKKQVEDNFDSQVQRVRSTVDAKTKQIEALQKEIAEAAAEEGRLEGIRRGFEGAHAQIAERLNAQRAHIASQKG